MLPSIDLRIRNLTKALREVVLPAIPEHERLARDQAMLVIGHVGMIAAQWKDAARFEAGSLHLLCGLARDLLQMKGDAVPPDVRAQLQTALPEAVDATNLQAIEAASLKIGRIVDRVISGGGTAAPMSPDLMDAVLQYGGRQAWRERAWFAANSLDPDAKELPPIEAVLSGADTRPPETGWPGAGGTCPV